MNKFKIIIPARKGSKRLEKKNIKILNGIPLIQHTINFAKDQSNFNNDDIWINTDCKDIKKIGESNAVNIYMRPLELGSDTTKTVEVLHNQLLYFINQKIEVDYLIILQPTNPLRPKNLIQEAIKIINKSSVSSLSTFSLLDKKYGNIVNNKFYPLNYKPGMRSQDVKKEYYENGLIYIASKENILSNKIISDDTYPLVLDHVFSKVDIDDLDDFNYANFLINCK